MPIDSTVEPTVVITRPLAQAEVFAERVIGFGRSAVVFPLLEIPPLADINPLLRALDHLSMYSMVAFVSPNAIEACLAHLFSWPKEVAIAVMGEGSRMALALHGINELTHTILSPIDPHRSDSETLFAALDIVRLRDKKVLIIRGETGRELLADTLRAEGVDVTQVAAYRRIAPVINHATTLQLSRLLQDKNDWIFTSSEALRNLMPMIAALDPVSGVAKMQRQHLIVPHIRIQETAQMLGFQNITLTGSGDDNLLAALRQTRLQG